MLLCSLLLPLHSLPHSSISIRISQRLLCQFSFHSINFTVCIAPAVAFALSAPFLSFQQHISSTSLSMFVSFHQFHWLHFPCCCLCALCPVPLFPAAYLQDFSVDVRFIPSISLAALPCCCLCALCPIPFFSSGHLKDFSAAFRFIPSVSLSALPLLLPLRSLPHSSLSIRTSQRLLC